MTARRLLTLAGLLFVCSYIDPIEESKWNDHKYKFVTLPRYGTLVGSVSRTTWTKRLIYQFLGVSYAESPSGDRLFKAPVPDKRWKGIHDARKLGRKCPVLNDLEGDRGNVDLEDCLNLAIYSPNLSGSLPVMVYVHGGRFTVGGADQYPPNYLLESDVVLVVVQYRLGALGFLSTNSDDIPGNAVLFDVQLALNFIKENIEHFGGNPNNVTLFGQSSGAVMSGSIFAKWCVATDPVQDAKDIAKAAGLNSSVSIASLNSAFMKMDVIDLLKAVEKYQKTGEFKLGGRSISIGGPTGFLPDLPQKIVSSPQYSNTIPMIIGTTKDDAMYIATVFYNLMNAPNQANWLANSRVTFVTVMMEMMCIYLDASGDACKVLQNLATNTLWTEEELAINDVPKMLPGLMDILGMLFFKVPALQLAISNSKNKTFMYTFDYEGEKTRFGYETDTSPYPFRGGCTHSDDLIYLFPYPLEVSHLNAADTEMAKQMVDLWTSFASFGSPRTIRNECSWKPMVSGTIGPYAHIDGMSTMGNDYTQEFVRNVRNVNEFELLIAMLLNCKSTDHH